ncbi:MAG: hypothetical protein AAGF92_15565 [Myxococcota bacterium]
MSRAGDGARAHQMTDHELLRRACLKIQEALVRGDVDLADRFLELASKRISERSG